MRRNLTDTTFVIPFFKDSEERLENLQCIMKYISDNFETNVIIVESTPKLGEIEGMSMSGERVQYYYINQDGPIFHRTKVINAGIKKATTPYVSIYDTDCVFNPEQILDAVKLLREGADACYPYGGDFVDIERSYITYGIIKERESFAKESVGGVVFLNRLRYKEAGLENEHLISHAPEDVERYCRMLVLEYKVERVPGKCWHITHSRGVNSGPHHPHVQANTKEYLKVRSLEKEDLKNYIKTWGW